MAQLILTPDRFVKWFQSKCPGTYTTVQEIKDMTACGLIGRYGYYGRSDIETARSILEYERRREGRFKKVETKTVSDVPRCKACGQPLSNESKIGRPKEYCPRCEPVRGRLRSRKWRAKAKQKRVTQINRNTI
jgi:hypothetical protein